MTCSTGHGTGTVYVEGGTYDERIPDICESCDGQGR